MEKEAKLYANIGPTMDFDRVLDEIVEEDDLNVKPHGITPLMAACMKKLPNIVRDMLIRGANPNILSKNGDTALDIANIVGATECARILRDSNKIEHRVFRSVRYIGSQIRKYTLQISMSVDPSVLAGIF